jgi:hypothetical protein
MTRRLCGRDYGRTPGKLNWQKLGWTQKETVLQLHIKAVQTPPTTAPSTGPSHCLDFRLWKEMYFF